MRAFLVPFACLLVACEGVDPGGPADAASGGQPDSALPRDSPETPSDAVIESGDTGDASGSCVAGAEEKESCGQCGTRGRTCDPKGAWEPWGGCVGEGACAPGASQTATEGCAPGQEKRRTCTDRCAWGEFGACIGNAACVDGSKEFEPCGNCGERTRECRGGSFGAWSACTKEGVCKIGDKRSSKCGRCGTREEVCGASCTWSTGSCTGEGVCAPGATDVSSEGCGANQEKTLTCSNACAWTASACREKACKDGTSERRSCGNCGTSRRMCSGGQWLPWRSCDFEGECKPGDTRTNTNACPGLQTRTETCDTSCGWVAGACTGQFTRFVDLWSGARVNYAKASDGRIFGWGAGAGNLLSATDDLDATLPKVVAHAPAGIVEASIDAELPFRAFGCVLLGDGAVHCVGKNDRGQLGVATSITSRATFERVVTGASQVRAKAATACALRNGAVTCWGALRLTPSGSQFQQIALAPDFACLLASGGRVTCWGRSSPLAIPSATEPRTLVQSSDIVEITATTDNICGRRAKGTVACWGSASNGLLGTTETVDRSVLGPDVRATSGPGVLSDVVQLASGDQYVCALLSSGRVACWGDGIYGTLGTGSQSGNGPSLATGISNAKKIAAGDNHVCALLETGEIACWGVNLAGATGTGTAGGVTTAPHRIRI